MIKFITTETPKSPTFKDVLINQFFVCYHGLCQKVRENSFTIIAKKDGRPYADHIENANESMAIDKILPHVEKIEF
jgi:hypothetical protein